MSLGPNNLQLCVDKLEAANNKLRTGPEFCRENTTMRTVIEAVAHLAEYCRTRVANHPALYPDQLDADMANLCARIEALESAAETPLPSWASENPDSPLYGTYARAEPDRGPWDCVLEQIRTDCDRHGWTDIDALMAWQMGRAAMLQARMRGARFRYERQAEEARS